MRTAWRAMKHIDSVGADLPPDDAVVVDASEEDLPMEAAIQTAKNGDWGPASILMNQTVSGPDWDLREHQAEIFAEAALADSRWVMSWLDFAPRDPNALLLRGVVFINRAWEQRGARLAKHTSADQFEGFFHYLELAEPALRAAIAANPADPTPWSELITWAMGSRGGEPGVFREAWSQVTARAPHHRGAHERALQYHCAKWHGSDERMFDFAYRAADAAPPDSALQTLPLDAWLEFDHTEHDTFERNAAHEAVTRAMTVCPPGRPATYRWSRYDRNLIAYALFRQERYEEALEQFRSIGVHATSEPWAYAGDEDARGNFLAIREGVRIEVAAAMERRNRS